MTKQITRREFLAASAGATSLGLGAGGDASDPCITGPAGTLTCALPQPTEAPCDPASAR